jgi:hypothetical protein
VVLKGVLFVIGKVYLAGGRASFTLLEVADYYFFTVDGSAVRIY